MTPNWHPFLAHFPIVLLLTGTVSLWTAALLRDSEFNRQLNNFGHWSLRLGFVFSVIAMASGALAYRSVPRDQSAHEALNMHYDIAGVVVAAMIPFFILSCLRHRLTRHITRAFTVGLIIPLIPLVYTSWLGYEAVYRYGLGVQSIQAPGGSKDTHMHRSGEAHGEGGSLSESGNVRYPDPDFGRDTGEAVSGEREDNQGD